MALPTALVAGLPWQLRFTECIQSVCGGFVSIPEGHQFHHASPAKRARAGDWGVWTEARRRHQSLRDKKRTETKTREKHVKDTSQTGQTGQTTTSARKSRAFHPQDCLHLLNIPSCSAPNALRQIWTDLEAELQGHTSYT